MSIYSGTKAAEEPVQPVVTTETATVPFEVVYENDATLPAGEQTVSQQGKNGQKRLTYTDGVLTSEEVLVEAVPQIVKVGTKAADVTSQEIETRKEAIPFETIVKTDYNKWADEVIVETSGVAGETTHTDTYETINGVRTGKKTTTSEVTKEKVDRVEIHGTKPIEGTEEVVTTALIAFATEEIPDETLPKVRPK